MMTMSDTMQIAFGLAGIVGGLSGIVGAILVWRGSRSA
jgi:ABC-type Mn2+/Zn2+ transport system permease subunit